MTEGILFGNVTTTRVSERGDTTVTVERKRAGETYLITKTVTEILKPTTRSELLSHFIDLLDTKDTSKHEVTFKIKPSKTGWTVERSWTE